MYAVTALYYSCGLMYGTKGKHYVYYLALWGVLGGQVPRLYGGTIFGGVQHTWGGPAGH